MAEAEELEAVRFDEARNLGAAGGVGAWLEYALTRGLLGTIGRLPDGARRALVSGAARLAMRLDARHREAARSFLRQALGCAHLEKDGDARILQAYRHLFRISLDAAAFDRRVPQATLLEHYRLRTCAGFEEAVRAGRGGVLVTPHVGDWEAAAAALPHLGMTPTYVVARPPRNRYLSEHLLRVRERKGVTVMPRRGGMAQAGTILERGGWIAMLLDQRPSGKHVVAPFFGRPAPCERGAAVLLKRMRVPVLIGANYLTDEPFRYDLRVTRVLQPEELAELSIVELVTLLNREMEALILRHPEQYFWLHDRYRGA
ncbi:MAG: lysophospholipid acyltransferase family protein [Planctomycetes bacterium]|nr:lysophospholipid acyltransferase family protein [Planctomycetota bacterium]